MKKQFQNIRNFVQDLNRGEKNDGLPTEILLAEKRVELIKQVCQLTEKKISACMRCPPGADSLAIERKFKKMPEYQLYQAFAESSDHIGADSIFGQTLVECAESQHRLSKDLLDHELEVERSVIGPLNDMLDTEIPTVFKCRKSLNKATQDMENCRQRYHVALKTSHQSTGPGVIAATNKAESLKKEWEESSYKVDQYKDIFASEVFSLLSREPKLSHLLFQYLKLQAQFHKQAFEQLEAALPKLHEVISNSYQKPLFGSPLEDHLRVSGREIALVIEACIACLMHNLSEEGLFRIPGSSSKVRKLKNGFDAGIVNLEEQVSDPHSVAGTLKSYLRELPEPLLTLSLYNRWISAAKLTDAKDRLQALWQVVHDLPKVNYSNLKYVIKFLDKIVQSSSTNKMSPQNLAIAMAPSLIWSPAGDEDSIGANMTAANYHSVIVDCLISNCDWFFPGALPLSQCQDGAQNDHFMSASNQDSSFNSVAQPPTRKAPRKPAPPVPPLTASCHEPLKTNNNDYSGKGTLHSPVPLRLNSDHKPPIKGSAFAIGSSSETIDSCGSRSPVCNGDFGSLDRRNVLHRNSSDRRPIERNGVTSYRHSKLVGKPNVPPPSIPRRPNIPPPERPERISSQVPRQKSAENLFEDSSSPKVSTLSKSFSVRSSSQDDATECVEAKRNDEVGERGDAIIEVESDFIRLELNTGIETTGSRKNGETLVTSDASSSEENKSFEVCTEMTIETDIIALSSPKLPHDVNSNTTYDTLLPPSCDDPAKSSDPPVEENEQELSCHSVRIEPRKPLPPPIKPRITSLNEASRL